MKAADGSEVFDGEDDETALVQGSAVAELNRSEVEAQLAAAHKYPRSIERFLKEAMTLATMDQDIAESCLYAVPRGGKTIAGPSVRLAEIAMSAYGNFHAASRVVGAEETEIVAQGVAWDLEKNLRVTVETRRRITDKKNRRYNADGITNTGNAAGSIALRNAVFRVIPRSYINKIYERARHVAVGDAKTLAAKRQDLLVRLTKIGVPPDRVFARIGKVGIEDIGLEDLEILIGLGTAIKNGDMTIDAAFPPVSSANAAPSALESELLGKATKDGELPHTPDATKGKKAKAPGNPLATPALDQAMESKRAEPEERLEEPPANMKLGADYWAAGRQ